MTTLFVDQPLHAGFLSDFRQIKKNILHNFFIGIGILQFTEFLPFELFGVLVFVDDDFN